MNVLKINFRMPRAIECECMREEKLMNVDRRVDAVVLDHHEKEGEESNNEERVLVGSH